MGGWLHHAEANPRRYRPLHRSHYQGHAMTKDEWIAAAAAKLAPYEFDNSRLYAEGLYKTYVEDDGDHWADDPDGAVEEDMSYWGD
jgi:hypothetical protein